MAISKKKIGVIAGGIVALLVVVAMASGGGGSSSASSSLEKGFRGIPWGISIQEAKEKYGLEERRPNLLYKKDENLTLGDTQLLNIEYIFWGDGNKLDRVSIEFSKNYTEAIVTTLAKMYGKPQTVTNTSIEWKLDGIDIDISNNSDGHIVTVLISKVGKRPSGGTL